MEDEGLVFTTRKAVPGPRVRFWLLGALLAVMCSSLLLRSFYLQIIYGSTFLATAEGNRVARLPISAPRGILYDVSGKALTENMASTDIILDPAILPAEEHETYLIDELPRILTGITPEAVHEAIRRARQSQRPVVVKKAVSHDELLALDSARETVYGVRPVSTLVRDYLYGAALAHVVGYTGAITAEEAAHDQELLPIDTTGKIGLEKTYEKILRGKPGATYLEVNAAGRPQQDLGRKEPSAGQDIHLTLDAELQQAITKLFEEAELRGAAVVLDPRDGAVRALVSAPSFDPNLFSQPGKSQEASSVTRSPHQPLFNRATDGAYPPGSTIKPFLALAGLEERTITEETTVNSTGGIQVGIWNFPDWKSGGHGVTDVKKAIAESVNTFFYILTGGDQNHVGLGVEKATRYLQKFGFGESPGFLPSKAWKEKTKKERWYIGDTYHLGIGQGDILVTPVQVATATAALVNGSALPEVYFTVDETSQLRPLPFRPNVVQIVREGMRKTVTDGSGKRLATFPIPLAGKTGTAQVGGEATPHAWFTSFGPYEAPELGVTVLLENAGEGDDAAVPFAEGIWRWWYENRFRAE